jgi:hypothetical protein
MQDVVHAPPSLRPANLEDVEGFTSASPRQSLTTGAGALRVDPIDGVRYRLARPVSHQHVGRGDSGRHGATFPHEYRSKRLLCGPFGTTYGDKGEQP